VNAYGARLGEFHATALGEVPPGDPEGLRRGLRRQPGGGAVIEAVGPCARWTAPGPGRGAAPRRVRGLRVERQLRHLGARPVARPRDEPAAAAHEPAGSGGRGRGHRLEEAALLRASLLLYLLPVLGLIGGALGGAALAGTGAGDWLAILGGALGLAAGSCSAARGPPPLPDAGVVLLRRHDEPVNVLLDTGPVRPTTTRSI